MPILFQTLRLTTGAAIIAAACAIAARASAQVPAPLLIGPGRVGTAVTYRLTTSDVRAGSAPNVQTLALRWKLGQKVVATLTSAADAQATPYVATRAADGRLTLDNVNVDDPEGQRIGVAVGVLNRLDGFVAAAPAGARTWKMTLVVQPPASRAAAPDAQNTQAPQPLNIPVAATRSDDATGTTLAASGSLDRTVTRPAGAGSPRGGGRGGEGGMGGGGGMGRRGGMGGGGMGGGGMGGGRMGGDMGGLNASRSIKVTTKITVDAHFGRDGELTSGTIVETSQAAGDQGRQNQQDEQTGQSPANPQIQPSTRTWQIERT